MAILDILTTPHPVLAAKARDVRDDEFGPALTKLTSDMAETMYAAPGVGLAAPQVGDGRRIVVIDSTSGENRGQTLYRMVNATIVERSRKTIFWEETCLSVPELEVRMERSTAPLHWRCLTGDHSIAMFPQKILDISRCTSRAGICSWLLYIPPNNSHSN